ncbi:MAG: response regulator [Candidatus Marinimicrobia bacterium]|nr:response regulator [Candidatus Neomarinimicrobiota bacterium]
MKILLVDDETMSREAMASFLNRPLGHDVTECENGEEALQIYKQTPFPVVLTDIRMPKNGRAGITERNTQSASKH